LGKCFGSSHAHLNGPKKHPLDYLEHFHWAVESEDSLIGEAIKGWGAERILFSADYPHSDTPWPESVSGMKSALKRFSADQAAKVMRMQFVSCTYDEFRAAITGQGSSCPADAGFAISSDRARIAATQLPEGPNYCNSDEQI
jgi:hypothetical protein